MSAELEPGVRYDMPAAFGPSVANGVEEGYGLYGATVSFVTARDAAAELMPPGFEPAEVPVVNVSHQRFVGLKWMGGRGYNIVSVYITATYRRDGRYLTAPLSMVIWENDCAPIISGREFMGTPKLFAEIPDIDVTKPSYEFECREYGSRLLQGSLSEMQPVPSDELGRITQQQHEIVRMHWKYIPGPNGQVDADYPVAMYASSTYEQVWKGRGEISFGRPSEIEAPYSSRIVARLAQLPTVKWLPATGFYAPSTTLWRERSVRLDTTPSALKPDPESRDGES